MHSTRNRKYPIQYKKSMGDIKSRAIDLSGATAVGILALTFVGGAVSGYFMKRWMD